MRGGKRSEFSCDRKQWRVRIAKHCKTDQSLRMRIPSVAAAIVTSRSESRCDISKYELFEDVFWSFSVIPGNKSRTRRCKKRWTHGPTAKKTPEVVSTPQRQEIASAVARPSTTAVLSSPSTPSVDTALSISPHVSIGDVDDDTGSSESECEMEGQGCELDGLKSVFQAVRCGECGEKGLEYREDFNKRHGLYTAPYLLYESSTIWAFCPSFSIC